ncbi:MAG: ferric reductase-like transmembrane domain-containing protein [Bryobacteraceae bacterium]|nr:ferric reductase-like transmembrane domain-containing protein [Bryobacteraceae bacterium]
MSLHYKAIFWNPVKKQYDLLLAGGVLLYLAAFTVAGALLHPAATIETLLIRGLATCAFLLLHLILCIGPLCRLNPRFLPLLYNRRHLGVTMFLIALAHAIFSIVQFHSLGDTNPLVSLLTGNTRFESIPQFPFELLGLAALVILFLMAATSHDFWLSLLTPRVWKQLHMGVYLAYGLLIGHVTLGALQSETNPLFVAITAAGITIVTGLHLAAGWRERRLDQAFDWKVSGEFVPVCPAAEIPANRAKMLSAGGERIAVFRYDNKISAISNVCQHQNGPLGEGRIVDGCVVCPWHGYQYLPDSGASPPPFQEKVATYRTRIDSGVVYVDPRPCPPGTRLEPSRIE